MKRVNNAKTLLNRRLFEKKRKRKRKTKKKNVSLTGSDRWHVKMAHENLNLYML